MGKWLGALVLLAYAALAFSRYEPFATEERGALPGDARPSPGGSLLWFTGFRGGK